MSFNWPDERRGSLRTPDVDEGGIRLRLLQSPDFRDAVLRQVYSANLKGFLPPNSIGQRSVDTPFVDDLPITAKDGDEIYYRATDTTVTHPVLWHLRFRGDVNTKFPWEFVGGNPLVAPINTSESTTSTAYTDLATVGPALTLPFAGDWRVQVGAAMFSDTSGQQARMSMQTTITAATDSFSAVCISVGANSGGSHDSQPGPLRNQSRGIAVVAKYRSTNAAATATFFNRWMAITPVRVSRSL